MELKFRSGILNLAIAKQKKSKSRKSSKRQGNYSRGYGSRKRFKLSAKQKRALKGAAVTGGKALGKAAINVSVFAARKGIQGATKLSYAVRRKLPLKTRQKLPSGEGGIKSISKEVQSEKQKKGFINYGRKGF